MNVSEKKYNSINIKNFLLEDCISLINIIQIDLKKDSKGDKLDFQGENKEKITYSLTRLIGHCHIYKYYILNKDNEIEYFFNKAFKKVANAITYFEIEKIGELVVNFTQKTVDTEVISWIDFNSKWIGFSIKNEINELIQKLITDKNNFYCFLIYLIDYVLENIKTKDFNELKKYLLKSIEEDEIFLYKKIKNDSDIRIYNNSLKDIQFPKHKFHKRPFYIFILSNFLKILKSLFLLRDVPYLVTILFAIVGYLFTFVITQYKDVPIIELSYQESKNITKDSIKKMFPALEFEEDSIFYNYKGKTLYWHKFIFENISFNKTIKDLTFSFDASEKIKIIASKMISNNTLSPEFNTEDEYVNGVNKEMVTNEKGGKIIESYHAKVNKVITNSGFEIYLFTNNEQKPTFRYKTDDSVIIIERSILTYTLKNKISSVLAFFVISLIFITVYLIIYSILKDS